MNDTPTIDYKSLLNQAKKVIKRDKASELAEIERQVVEADYRVYEWHEFNLEFINRIIELTRNGNEIIVEKCERRKIGNSLMYWPTAEEKAIAENEIRNKQRVKFDAIYKQKLDEIVEQLSLEFVEASRIKAQHELSRDNENIKQAILKMLGSSDD